MARGNSGIARSKKDIVSRLDIPSEVAALMEHEPGRRWIVWHPWQDDMLLKYNEKYSILTITKNMNAMAAKLGLASHTTTAAVARLGRLRGNR